MLLSHRGVGVVVSTLLCGSVPLLVQRTLVPTLIVRLGGMNPESTMLTSTVVGMQVAVAVGEPGVLVSVTVGVLVEVPVDVPVGVLVAVLVKVGVLVVVAVLLGVAVLVGVLVIVG